MGVGFPVYRIFTEIQPLRDRVGDADPISHNRNAHHPPGQWAFESVVLSTSALEVEAIQLHHLAPCGDEVFHEFSFRILTGIHL